MKRLLLVSAIMLLVACNSDHSFVLNGTLTNVQDGEMISLLYPEKRDGIWFEQCDTTYVHNGKFRFEGKVKNLVPAELVLSNMDYAQIFLEPSHVKFSAERTTLFDYSISGLSIDDDLQEYHETFAECDKAIHKKRHEIMRKNEECIAASNAGLESADRLWSEFYELVEEFHAINGRWQDTAIEFIRSYPNNRLAPNIIGQLVGYGYNMQSIDSLVSILSATQRNSTLGELMTIRCEIAKHNGGQVGSKAPDFTLCAVDGRQITLSDCCAEGYVLLDFWASWCSPCIQEIPNVHKLYEAYNDKLKIISISVDNDETEWQKAVEKLNLTEWTQLIIDYPEDAESYYFAEQADLSLAYGIEEIPCFILVDRNGLIAGRWSHLTPATISEIEQIINR